MLSEMGFISDQEGIVSRYSRELAQWNEHLEQSKQCICEAVQHYNPKSVAILGSGWLFDVPIEFLSKHCEHVYLYDIVHPSQIKHKTSKFGNVTAIEADLTGNVIQLVWEQRKQNKKQIDLNNIVCAGFNLGIDVDLVVSLNILNQLDILICDYISQEFNVSEEELLPFRKRIQYSHIESLSKSNYCLITDFEEHIYSLNGEFEKSNSLVKIEIPTKPHVNYWKWKFDKSGAYYENKEVVFNVVGTF